MEIEVRVLQLIATEYLHRKHAIQTRQNMFSRAGIAQNGTVTAHYHEDSDQNTPDQAYIRSHDYCGMISISV